MQLKRAATLSGCVAVLAVAVRTVACASFGIDARGAGTDASTDASTAAPNDADVASPFCATQDASFCADFDEGPDAAAGWSGIALSRTGTISETSTARSSPSALSSRVGADGGQARLKWRFPSRAKRTTLAFDLQLLRPKSLSIGDSFAIAELDCVNVTDAGAATDWGGVWLAGGTEGDSNRPNLQLTAGGKTKALNDLPPGWSHVVIDVAWAPPQTHITMTVGRNTVFDADSGESCFEKTEAFVFLGVASDSPNETIFDNVVVNVGF